MQFLGFSRAFLCLLIGLIFVAAVNDVRAEEFVPMTNKRMEEILKDKFGKDKVEGRDGAWRIIFDEEDDDSAEEEEAADEADEKESTEDEDSEESSPESSDGSLEDDKETDEDADEDLSLIHI